MQTDLRVVWHFHDDWPLKTCSFSVILISFSLTSCPSPWLVDNSLSIYSICYSSLKHFTAVVNNLYRGTCCLPSPLDFTHFSSHLQSMALANDPRGGFDFLCWCSVSLIFWWRCCPTLRQNGQPGEARRGGEGHGPYWIERAGDPGEGQVPGRSESPDHEEREGARQGRRHPHPSRVREGSQAASLIFFPYMLYLFWILLFQRGFEWTNSFKNSGGNEFGQSRRSR